MENKNSAKFAFLYMLSLVALVFVAISVGIVLFQIINKSITDVIADYSGQFNPEALKFAISALLIASPIYFVVMRLINRSLGKGELSLDSAVRRWLTYFILLVSSVVMIGWLIGTVNSFLNGELTLKFVLKFLSAVGISALIFSYYLYDIKRQSAEPGKNKVVKAYFYAALALVLAAFVLAAANVESPRETKNRKIDETVLRSFNDIRFAVDNYYQNNNRKLPESLDQVSRRDWSSFDSEEDTRHPVSGESYEYQVLSENEYELCANFLTSNQQDDALYRAFKDDYPHDSGRQCFKLQVREDSTKPVVSPELRE